MKEEIEKRCSRKRMKMEADLEVRKEMEVKKQTGK
jgi:hypothetical protein